MLIVTCNLANLTIFKVYMKGQVENSKCNEWVCKCIDCLEKETVSEFEGWLDILKEQQSCIWSGRIQWRKIEIYNQKFSYISFKPFHCYFLTILVVIPKSLSRVSLTTISNSSNKVIVPLNCSKDLLQPLLTRRLIPLTRSQLIVCFVTFN